MSDDFQQRGGSPWGTPPGGGGGNGSGTVSYTHLTLPTTLSV